MFAKAIAFAAAFTIALALATGSAAAGGACLPAAGQPTQGTGTAVSIKNCLFGPSITHVPVGTTVTWTNDDYLPHAIAGAGWTANVTPSGQPDPFGMFNPGMAVSFTFKEQGIFAYMCHLHPGMTGVVVVGDVAYPGAASAAASPAASQAAPAPASNDVPFALGLLVVGAAIGVAGYRLRDGALAIRRGLGVLAR